MRAFRLALVPVLALLWVAHARAADVTERWFEVRLSGRPAGWTRAVERRVPEGWRTETETRLRLRRGTTTLDMVTTGWIVESETGAPLSGGRTQAGSGQSQRVSWRYRSDGIEERTVDLDRVTDRTLPAAPEKALPPHAAEADARARREAGANEIEQVLFEPAQGAAPQRVRAVREGDETIVVAGEPVPATRWRLEGPLVPPGSREWRSATGELLRSMAPTGIGAVESVLSDAERAARSLDRAGSGPEVMVASFAEADRPMSDPSRLRKAAFRVRAEPGSTPIATGFQAVRTEGAASMVTVDLDAPGMEASERERSDPSFLAASPMIDPRDPVVRALAERALASAPADRAMRIERLRRATGEALPRKNLSSALSSAGEALRTGTGDCTEHAVVLAALLRSQGIPSRVVAGLIWCDEFSGRRDVFGWHLWTQALVEGRWIDLDATLPVEGPAFHPGHIAFAVTALSDPAGDPALVRLLGALGALRIEVLDGAR
jgi:transglutaminase-like putative cysteine protease